MRSCARIGVLLGIRWAEPLEIGPIEGVSIDLYGKAVEPGLAAEFQLTVHEASAVAMY